MELVHEGLSLTPLEVMAAPWGLYPLTLRPLHPALNSP
jgi:hypothetical protein